MSTRNSAEEVILESDAILVRVDPRMGGKIRSFYSKRTGKEYLYQDPRSSVQAGSGYSDHDISGFDECFPTVWPCDYPDGKRKGLSLGDHGLLWQSAWQYEIEKDRLAMGKDIPELRCRFERTCSLDTERSLRLEYQITHDFEEPLKYIYSAHPLLAATEHTRLSLPAEIDSAYVFFAANVAGVREQSWLDWPPADRLNLHAPYSGQRESCIKLYSRKLNEGLAAVHHLDKQEGLRFEFDPSELPYLGFLIQQGYDANPAGAFKGELFLALEPTTGIGDDLPTCATTGTVAELLPGQTKCFTIRLSLIDL